MQLIKHILSVDITHILRAYLRLLLLLLRRRRRRWHHHHHHHHYPALVVHHTYYIIIGSSRGSYIHICLLVFSVSLLSIFLSAIGCGKRIKDFNLNGCRRLKMIHSDTKQYMLSTKMKLKTHQREKRVTAKSTRSKFDELKFRFIKDVIARCDFD